MASKQSELKGVERPKVADIEESADDYVRLTDLIKARSDEKKQAMEKLVAAMRRAKLEKYKYDDRIITLLEVDKIKVASLNGDSDED